MAGMGAGLVPIPEPYPPQPVPASKSRIVAKNNFMLTSMRGQLGCHEMASLGCPHKPKIGRAEVCVVMAKQNECHNMFTLHPGSRSPRRGKATSYVVGEFSRPGGCAAIHNPVTLRIRLKGLEDRSFRWQMWNK